MKYLAYPKNGITVAGQLRNYTGFLQNIHGKKRP